MKTHEEHNEEWNTWANHNYEEAKILVDGHQLSEIVNSVKYQVELLRKKSIVTNDSIDSIQMKLNPVLVNHSKLNFEDIEIMLEKITSLENNYTKITTINNKIDKVDRSLTQNYDELNATLLNVINNGTFHSMLSNSYDEKIQQLQTQYDEKLKTISIKFEKRMINMQKIYDTYLLDIDNKLNSLKNFFEINEYRLKTLEQTVTQTCDNIRDIKTTLDYFPIKHLDSIHHDIAELFSDKANKIDLNKKADINFVQSKADQIELERLHLYADEVNRRLAMQIKDFNDNIVNIDDKLDRRMQSIGSWCLRHIRKELKANPNAFHLDGTDDRREGGGGTDIGKVRCLVCDQVVPQQKTAGTSVHAPSMRGVIKPQQQQQQHQQGVEMTDEEQQPESRGRVKGKIPSSTPGPIATSFAHTLPVYTYTTHANIAPSMEQQQQQQNQNQQHGGPSKKVISYSLSMPKLNSQTINLNAYNSNGAPIPTTIAHSKLVKLGGEPLHFPIPLSPTNDDFNFKTPYMREVEPLVKPGLEQQQQQQEVHHRPRPLGLNIEPMPLQSLNSVNNAANLSHKQRPMTAPLRGSSRK